MKRQISVRTFLLYPNTIATISLVILSFLVISTFIEKSVEMTVLREHNNYRNNISDYVNNLIDSAELQLRINQSFFETDEKELDLKKTIALFRHQLVANPDIDYLYITTSQGQIISVGNSGSFAYSTKEDPFTFLVFSDENPSVPLKKKPELDFRKKDWYANAVNIGEVLWTAPYPGEQEDVFGISASKRILNSDDSLLGVLGTDILLDDLSDFIKGIDIVDGGYIYLYINDNLIAQNAEIPEIYTSGDNETAHSWHDLTQNITNSTFVHIDSDQYVISNTKVEIKSQENWSLLTAIPIEFFQDFYIPLKTGLIFVNITIIGLIFLINIFISFYFNNRIKYVEEFFSQLKNNRWNGQMEQFTLKEFNKISDSVNLLLNDLDESVKTLEKKEGELDSLNKNVSQIVESRTHALKKLSYEDPLTGAYNRRYFSLFFDTLIEQQKDFSIAQLDIDFFKPINDRFGHNIGDEVLKDFVNFFKSRLRKGDIIVRTGGEEFILVINNSGLDDALSVVDRYKKEMREIKFSSRKLDLKFSGGVAKYCGQTETALVAVADEALYRAKHAGRDMILASTKKSE